MSTKNETKSIKEGKSKNPKEMDFATFHMQIQGKAFVKMGASWCGPCKRFAPIFHEVGKLNKSIAFIDVDIDRDETVTQYVKKAKSFNSVPEVFVFLNGKYRGKLSDFTTDDLKTAAQTYFKEPLVVPQGQQSKK